MQIEHIGTYLHGSNYFDFAFFLSLSALAAMSFFRLFKRKRQEDEYVTGELAPLDKETQFASAADHAEFSKDREGIALQIAGLFRDHLSMTVLAIYAGRADDDSLFNTLPSDVGQEADPARPPSVALPDRILSTTLQSFTRPQTTIVAEFTGGGYQETPVNTGELVAVVPWRGPFYWGGLIVGQPSQPFDPDTFIALSSPISRLGEKLAVALEIERERVEATGEQDLARKVFDFSRTIMASNEEASPPASMARAVASLLGADSAAIWRVDAANTMVRVEGSYGLSTEDFLPLPVGQGLAGCIIETGQSITLEDAPADPRCLFPREARENGIVSYLGVPIGVGGKVVGVVEAHAADTGVWREGDHRLLASAAQVISEALKSEEVQGDRLKVEISYMKLSEALQRLRSRGELLEAAVEVLGHALGVSRAVAVELNESGQAEPVNHEYRAPDIVSSADAVSSEAFISNASNALASSKVVEVSDSREQSLLGPQEAERLHVLSEMMVPIKVEEQLKGFIYLHQCDRIRQWQVDEVGFAERVGRHLSLSLTNLRALEKAGGDAEKAQEEARKAGDAMSRLRALVASLPEAVLGLDREGRLTFFNEAGRDWLGLKGEDIGRMVEMTESLSVTDDSLWGKVVASKSVSRFYASLVRMTGSSGGAGATTQGATPVPISLSVAPVSTKKGEAAGFVVLISDARHMAGIAEESAARIAELERGLGEMSQSLSDARSNEAQLRGSIEQFKAAEAHARSAIDASRRLEAELRKDVDRLREEEGSLRKSAQQLLEINRLKSEFIVNAGRELESSLQSVLGLAELLERGTYGTLTGEQMQAIHGIYNNARRMRQDVDWLVEYGSTRSRRLESGGEGAP